MAASMDGVPTLELSAFRALHPSEYLAKFLKEGVRPDGRVPDASRPVTIVAGFLKKSNGSALVKVGSTTVVAGVQCMVTIPNEGMPRKGLLELDVEFSSLCGISGNEGAFRGRGASISDRMVHHYLSIGALEADELCIEEGKAVWAVKVNVTILDDDGGVDSAVSLALGVALADTRLPAVHMTPAGVQETGEADHTLPLRSIILTSQTSIVHDTPLLDPTKEEETAQSATILSHVALPIHEPHDLNLCALDVQASTPIKTDIIQHHAQQATLLLTPTSSLVFRALKKHQ